MFTTLLLIAYCYLSAGSLTTDLNSTGKYINGAQYTIKSVGATYTQHVTNHGMYLC